MVKEVQIFPAIVHYFAIFFSKNDREIWDHLEHIPTVTVTFVHATFVLVTYVHIRNISAVTDPILMKL